MIKTAKGSMQFPEKNVKAQLELNREILDKNFYMFKNMLNYKSKKFGKICFKLSESYVFQTISKI
ncbi:MAG: hypothetical protein ISN64_03490 [Rickettsia sp.]|nr:hypothetical protein [Rickettsia sp.]